MHPALASAAVEGLSKKKSQVEASRSLEWMKKEERQREPVRVAYKYVRK